MSDRDALFAAILANPDDDTPRLILADWLDEHGNKADREQARFIRLECDLARRDPFAPAPQPEAKEADKLELKYYKQWGAGLDKLVLMTRFRRGFVEEVTMYSKRFVAEGSRLFEEQPVRAVKFADMTSGRGAAPLDELFACPLLARLHTVHFVGAPVNDDFAGHLTRSPHLAGIRRLRLQRSGISPEGLVSIMESKGLPALTELDLSDNVVIDSEHLAALSKSRALSRLEVLDLSGTSVGAEGAGALARSEYSANLKVLRIGYNLDGTHTPLRGPGAEVLAESPHLRGLKELVLQGQELRKKGAEAFAHAYAWPGLSRLSLRGNGILASALPAFVANPAFRSLIEFDLSANKIRPDHLAAFKEACPDTLFICEDRPW